MVDRQRLGWCEQSALSGVSETRSRSRMHARGGEGQQARWVSTLSAPGKACIWSGGRSCKSQDPGRTPWEKRGREKAYVRRCARKLGQACQRKQIAGGQGGKEGGGGREREGNWRESIGACEIGTFRSDGKK